MSSPPPKKRKLTRHSVVTINLPDPDISPDLSSDDEKETNKPQSSGIYVLIEGIEIRFKCDAKALQQSNYFAKHIPEVKTETAEFIVTVPRTISIDRLRPALAWMHKDINDRDSSTPKYPIPEYPYGPILMNIERYNVARKFGVEKWANTIVNWKDRKSVV